MTLFGNPDASNVTRVTMDDAVTLATFYVNEAARLTDAATISKDTADAEKLRRWICLLSSLFGCCVVEGVAKK